MRHGGQKATLDQVGRQVVNSPLVKAQIADDLFFIDTNIFV